MKNQHKQILLASALIALGVFLRVIHLIPNFSPVAAIALFAGAFIADKRLAILIPVVSMLIGDLILSKMTHYPFFHDTFVFVYIAFILIAVLGFLLKENQKPVRVVGFAIGSSLLFFIISNFGVWIAGNLYPTTFSGFVTCYIKAIPFYKWSLVSNILYTAVLFTVYSILVRKTTTQLRSV